MVSWIDDNNIRTHCYYPNYHHRPTFSTNDTAAFQHPNCMNNFPKYYEYQDNFRKSELDQNQLYRMIPKHLLDDHHRCLMETITRGYGVRRYVDRFQFPHEIQYVDQHIAEGNYPPMFRSILEVTNPTVHHHHHSNPPTDELSSYLAPPALDHAERTYAPTNKMVLPPVPNRASCKGRFDPTKLSSFKSQSPPPSFTNNNKDDLRDSDIVCGRGKHARSHKGNKNFHGLILQHQSTYLFSKRSEKARVAWNVFDIVSSHGGRFVRRVNKKKASRRYENSTSNTTSKKASCHYNWEQLNERQAHEKICQSLREGAPELRKRMLQRCSKEKGEELLVVAQK
jgi:hypothetical protein